MNDDKWIKQTLDGDKSAFENLVLEYQDRLFSTMLHVTGNAEDAADVVQEAFLQAFLHLDTFRSSSRFFTWLYRIAFNTAIGFRRKKRPGVVADDVLNGFSKHSESDWGMPQQAAENKEMGEILRKSIDRLDDEYRSAIVLRELDGCSYEEISLILDIPPGTVRSRLHRARGLLHDMLKKYERDF